MSKKIIVFLITIICFALSADGANKKFTLVIDPGHGGSDAGALGAISKEKNLTLKFALAFGKMVERNCPDVKVIYTRKTDRFVELYRRAEIANNNKADLFISVHINAVPRGRVARGFQTYTLGTSKRTGKRNGVEQNLEVAKRENAVILLEKDYKQTYQGYDPNSPESNIMFEFVQDKNMENSVELAKYMQRYVCQATGRKDMGAQQDNLAVLRLSSMPGCLIELGFISTRDEENYMNSKAAEGQYARGIFNAFLAYYKKHGGNKITIPYQPEPENKEVRIPSLIPQDQVKVRPSKKTKVKEPEPQPVEEELVVVPVMTPQQEPVVETTPEPQPESEQPVVTEEQLVVAPVAPQPAAVPTPQQPAAAPAPQLPVQKSQPVAVEKPLMSEPVFKVQVLVSSSRLKPGDSRFKGLKGVDSYQEGNVIKYTVGASTNYNEIYRLRRSITDKFPEAFIIAFKDGQRVDVNEAIREFKKNKGIK